MQLYYYFVRNVKKKMESVLDIKWHNGFFVLGVGNTHKLHFCWLIGSPDNTESSALIPQTYIFLVLIWYRVEVFTIYFWCERNKAVRPKQDFLLYSPERSRFKRFFRETRHEVDVHDNDCAQCHQLPTSTASGFL